MKMRIKLVIDVWRDIFDFFAPSDRKQLAMKFNEFGDRQFSELCQKWLHEWTKSVRIGPILVPPPPTKWIRNCGGRLERKFESARLQCWDRQGQLWKSELIPLAETELPDNVKDFRSLEIRYLDTNVLQFLHRMHSLFTVRNIDLTLFNDDKESMKAAQSAFDHLLPLSTAGGRIEIVEMFASDYLLTVRGRLSAAQFFDIKTITMWLNGKLKEDIVELLLSWLYTSRREDGASRVLMLESFDRNVRGFLERVREHFIKATEPANFFISITSFWENPLFWEIQESTSANVRTNEQLVVRRKPGDEEEDDVPFMFIGRCPSHVDGRKWVEETDRNREIDDMNGQRVLMKIDISILGPIEEPRPEESEKGEEEDVDVPGPSKKQKLY